MGASVTSKENGGRGGRRGRLASGLVAVVRGAIAVCASGVAFAENAGNRIGLELNRLEKVGAAIEKGLSSAVAYHGCSFARVGSMFTIFFREQAPIRFDEVQQCDLEAGDFVWTGGDCHLYLNHLEQADLQLTRTPKALPRLVFQRRPPSIFDYRYEDFAIEGYAADPHIRAAVSV